MAVQLRFDICQHSNCKSLTFKELTNTYSSSNTGGWGSPNEATSDATAATLTIQSVNWDTNVATTLATINLFTAGFPTTNTSQEYYIPSSTLGYTAGTQIPDGEYIFTYSVTTSTTTYTQVKKKLLFCQIECCVLEMTADLSPCDCDCQDITKTKAFKAQAMLEGLKYLAGCGNSNEFEEVLDILERLCDSEDCSTCN